MSKLSSINIAMCNGQSSSSSLADKSVINATKEAEIPERVLLDLVNES